MIFEVSADALVAQNGLDLWIFENQKISIQKVKVTIRKSLWIFINDLSRLVLG